MHPSHRSAFMRTAAMTAAHSKTMLSLAAGKAEMSGWKNIVCLALQHV